MVPVLADMELTGMTIDKEYATRLSNKYHKMLDELDQNIEQELKKYTQKVVAFKNSPDSNVIRTGSKTVGEQIQVPINITSPTQLAILIYDVLKLKPVSTKQPRGTGEEILIKLQEKNPEFTLGNLILEKRGLEKLINTYIDKLVECISPVDGRLHAHFNQIGADTGRLSSSDPNLQNIPSKNNEIRMMFVAGDRYEFVQGDSEFDVYFEDDVETTSGYVCASDIQVGDALKVTEDNQSQIVSVKDIKHQGNHIVFVI